MPFNTQRSSTGNASRLIWQQRFDHAPLEVGQVVSAHAEPEPALHATVKPKVATGQYRWQHEHMDPAAFIARIRDHYVDQFRAFAEQQRARCTQGAPEVKFNLNDQSELFNQLYCVDFIKNDGAVEMVELQPENILTFEPITGTFGNSSLAIKYLRWDDVLMRHDLDELPADQLSKWFQLWFDPEDARHNPQAELSETIHSLVIQHHSISIDFGTAKPDAFWDILQLLDDAGVTYIEVSSSRAEAEKED